MAAAASPLSLMARYAALYFGRMGLPTAAIALAATAMGGGIPSSEIKRSKASHFDEGVPASMAEPTIEKL